MYVKHLKKRNTLAFMSSYWHKLSCTSNKGKKVGVDMQKKYLGIPYILIEEHLKSYNLYFVLIKKVSSLVVS